MGQMDARKTIESDYRKQKPSTEYFSQIKNASKKMRLGKRECIVSLSKITPKDVLVALTESEPC